MWRFPWVDKKFMAKILDKKADAKLMKNAYFIAKISIKHGLDEKLMKS